MPSYSYKIDNKTYNEMIKNKKEVIDLGSIVKVENKKKILDPFFGDEEYDEQFHTDTMTRFNNIKSIDDYDKKRDLEEDLEDLMFYNNMIF
jgi:hypothetical protein